MKNLLNSPVVPFLVAPLIALGLIVMIFGIMFNLFSESTRPPADHKVVEQEVDVPAEELEEDPTPPMEDLESYKLVEEGDDSWHTVELAVTLTNSTDEMQDYDVYYALLDSDGVRVLTGYGMVTDVKPGQTVKEKLMTELKSAKGLTAEVIRVDRYTQEW